MESSTRHYVCTLLYVTLGRPLVYTINIFQTPSGPVRETPPEGLTLPDDTYVPGKVNVWIPLYSLQRDSRYWEEPLSFMPERWTDERPNAILDKRAFLPFLTGPYNCVGQRLAMMEMRSVTANLIRSFEIDFAEGEDGSTIENRSRDCFTMNVGKLDVKLLPR
jgi:cytochrome P450